MSSLGLCLLQYHKVGAIIQEEQLLSILRWLIWARLLQGNGKKAKVGRAVIVFLEYFHLSCFGIYPSADPVSVAISSQHRAKNSHFWPPRWQNIVCSRSLTLSKWSIGRGITTSSDYGARNLAYNVGLSKGDCVPVLGIIRTARTRHPIFC